MPKPGETDSSAPVSKRQPWSPPAAIALVLISFAALPRIAELLLALPPALLLGWDGVDAWFESPLASFLYVLLAETLTIGMLFWFIRKRQASFTKSIALSRRPRWLDAGYAATGIFMYLALFVITVVVVRQLFPINIDQEQAIGFERSTQGWTLLFPFISLVILPPIAEEIIFRGFLYGTLRKHRVSVIWSTLGISLLFGAFHLFGGADNKLLWIAALDTFVLSVVLCHVREKTGAIWASIAIHALKNGFVFLNLFVF